MRAGLARRLEETGRQGRENSRLPIAKVLLLVSIKCDHLRKTQIVVHSGEETVASH